MISIPYGQGFFDKFQRRKEKDTFCLLSYYKKTKYYAITRMCISSAFVYTKCICVHLLIVHIAKKVFEESV